MARIRGFALGLLVLAGCASKPQPLPQMASADDPPPLPESAVYKNRFGSEFPLVLTKAMEDAYANPYPHNCSGVVHDVQALDAVLGEDIDSGDGGEADEKFASILTGAIAGLIPYRSWLMRLSGEHRRERRGLAAIAAGSIRRAYLKGLGEAWDCPLPGKPKRPEVERLPDF